MPVVYHCPHCHQPVSVPDAVLGQAITCPHCRGAFQTFPPAPPAAPAPAPPPVQQKPLSLDDDDEPEETGDGFDTLGTSSRSRRGPSGAARQRAKKKGLPLPNLFAMIAAITGSVIVMVYNQSNRKPGQGFDVKEVLISAVVGGVCAGLGYGLGMMFDTSKPAPKRRARRFDDADDE